MIQWYVLVDGAQQLGPMPAKALVQLVLDGKVGEDVLVYSEVVSGWVAFSSVSFLASLLKNMRPAAPGSVPSVANPPPPPPPAAAPPPPPPPAAAAIPTPPKPASTPPTSSKPASAPPTPQPTPQPTPPPAAKPAPALPTPTTSATRLPSTRPPPRSQRAAVTTTTTSTTTSRDEVKEPSRTLPLKASSSSPSPSHSKSVAVVRSDEPCRLGRDCTMSDCVKRHPGDPIDEVISGGVRSRSSPQQNGPVDGRQLWGKHKAPPNAQPFKVLIFGASGSGKSTLINTMANYFRGGKCEAGGLKVAIRTKWLMPTEKEAEGLEHNETGGSGTSAQTKEPVVYRFEDGDGWRYEWIDTPGLIDTEGAAQDAANIMLIQQAAKAAGYINALCLVFNGTVVRVTKSVQGMLTQLKGSVPDAVLDNLMIVLTCCDQTSVNMEVKGTLQCLGGAVDYGRSVFCFDNRAFSTDPSSWHALNGYQRQLLELSWGVSMSSMYDLMERVRFFNPADADSFERLMRIRHEIKQEIATLLNEIKQLDQVKVAMAAAQQAATRAQSQAQLSSAYMTQEVIEIDEKQATPYHNTLCQMHKHNCHVECQLNEDVSSSLGAAFLVQCQCMDEHTRGCNQCPGGTCDIASHYHARHVWVKTQKTVDRILQDMKLKHDEATHTLSTTGQHLSSFETQRMRVDQSLQGKMDNITRLCRDLRSICRGANIADEVASVVITLEYDLGGITDVDQKKAAMQRIQNFKTLATQLGTALAPVHAQTGAQQQQQQGHQHSHHTSSSAATAKPGIIATMAHTVSSWATHKTTTHSSPTGSPHSTPAQPSPTSIHSRPSPTAAAAIPTPTFPAQSTAQSRPAAAPRLGATPRAASMSSGSRAAFDPEWNAAAPTPPPARPQVVHSPTSTPGSAQQAKAAPVMPSPVSASAASASGGKQTSGGAAMPAKPKAATFVQTDDDLWG